MAHKITFKKISGQYITIASAIRNLTGGDKMAITTEEQTTAPEATKKPAEKATDNVIFVGKKPTMSYVLAVITQFNSGVNEVKIKARGRSISRAVDVAEVVNNKFVSDVKKDISTNTEEITDEKGNKLNVSAINITLKK